MTTVFVNYRTGDEEFAAALIDDDLSSRFGPHHVFRAAKSIELGKLFPPEIESALRRCKVLLCVIGERWSTVSDPSGQRMLDRPGDWVRYEIDLALRHGATVIPLLLRKKTLSAEELPPDITVLAKLQYQRLYSRSLKQDMAVLAERLSAMIPELRAVPGLTALGTEPVTRDEPWRGGSEVSVGGRTYLLLDPVEENFSPDHCWVSRAAHAEPLDPPEVSLFLRQLRVLRPQREGSARRDALVAEGELLRSLAGSPGIPRLHEVIDTKTEAGLVIQRSHEPSLRKLYGPTTAPLPGFQTAQFLRLAASLCAVLDPLHRQGLGHRDLGPDSILVLTGESRVGLRDLGLATLPIRAGEGRVNYRAPEQERGSAPAGTGPQTIDVYQIAATVRHVLTGRPYSTTHSPPLTITNPELPAVLDKVLGAALHVDPRHRPANAQALGDQLNTVIGELDRGDRQ